MLTTRPRGTNDILPTEVKKWQYIETVIRDSFDKYGYDEIRTPIFEHTELFLRSVGESSDIVSKEMYSFEDKGFRHITLRPEGTASTVRAYIENKLFSKTLPQKLFYIGPMFRYDQPQAGRYRQFHQLGCEVFGSVDPIIDAEIIAFAIRLFEGFGLKELEVKLNTVGCQECRPAFLKALTDYFSEHIDDLCPTCQERLNTNPLRILDCKEESCSALADKAPNILSYVCTSCKNHFHEVRSYLDALHIAYTLDHTLVRGLNYYTQTAFEIVSSSHKGQQNAICGGGRYNKLVEECGGPLTPGVGFAAGVERLLLMLEEQSLLPENLSQSDVYFIGLDPLSKKQIFVWADALRKDGYKVMFDAMGKGLKAQLKTADRMNAHLAVIIGEDEYKKEEAIVRYLQTSEQITMPFGQVIDHIKEYIDNVES